MRDQHFRNFPPLEVFEKSQSELAWTKKRREGFRVISLLSVSERS